MFENVSPSPDLPALERAILEYWGERDIQAKAMRKSLPGKPPFVFYEGPPTANGRPGIHHVSARAVKDVFCRFKTMQGHRVDRRGGWDTHGLPVEIEVEKEIGSKSKGDIEKYGIAAFNARCKESVFRYIKDWRALTERIGFWVDLDRSYITYERDYIESEWWILKNLWDRSLLYRGYKTTMHCPRCNTSLADHEVSQGVREDVDDPSVWIPFEVDAAGLAERGLLPSGEVRPVALLAWTTTPWTLPANTALALAPATAYALVEAPAFRGAPEDEGRALFIVADGLVDQVFEEGTARRVGTFEAERLAGLAYSPVMLGDTAGETAPHAHQVLIDESVDTSTGTGVLHIAPAYGDLELGQRHGLPVYFSAGRDGEILPAVRLPDEEEGRFAGLFFKAADKEIIRALRARGRLFRSERIKHAYPHCWRDDTPLMFLAKDSWYLRTTAVKDRMIANNQSINWFPDHVRNGRFGRWLENNVDWSISRERFWGCPLPIWMAEDGDALCVGSVAELEALCGRSLAELDLHRPAVDEIVFDKDGKTYKRVPETVDVWFDSGAMPYCQWHYPFENKEMFESQFPADFISEAMDQTRGWFYSLHAISALLTYSGDATTPAGPLADRWPDTPAFRNVVVQGFVNDEHDRKMSKSRGNTIDPWTVLDKEGSDALRWYILNNSPPGKNLAFKRPDIAKQGLPTLLTLWNVYAFFVTYASLSAPSLWSEPPAGDRPEIDRWLDSRRNQTIVEATAALETFDAAGAMDAVSRFINDDMSNWYVRRNRQRFWGRLEDNESQSAFRTLYDALLTIVSLIAPFTPFLAEAIYLNLVRPFPGAAESVHLANWPEADPAAIDADLTRSMDLVLELVHLGRSARMKSGIRVRQPLRRMHVRVRDEAERDIARRYAALITDELNIRELDLIDDMEVTRFADFAARPNFVTLGKRLGSKLAALRGLMATAPVQARIVEALLAGRPVEIDLGEGDEAFAPGDFLLDLTERGGFAVSLDEGRLAALETDLDDELVEEGRLREILRQLQEARRRAGLAVSDRIVLSLDGDGADALVAAHGPMLASELLAVRVKAGSMPDAESSTEVSLSGSQLTAYFARAE